LAENIRAGEQNGRVEQAQHGEKKNVLAEIN